jgi:hypothetical protein
VIEGVKPAFRASLRNGTAALLELMREAGGDVIGLDWRVRLDEAWQRVGHDVAVMGNLDPYRVVARRTLAIADEADSGSGRRRPGHIFNLGHGILPETPVENVIALVEMVHEMSRRSMITTRADRVVWRAGRDGRRDALPRERPCAAATSRASGSWASRIITRCLAASVRSINRIEN